MLIAAIKSAVTRFENFGYEILLQKGGSFLVIYVSAIGDIMKDVGFKAFFSSFLAVWNFA